jgi:hypothetical protein
MSDAEDASIALGDLAVESAGCGADDLDKERLKECFFPTVGSDDCLEWSGVAFADMFSDEHPPSS